VWVSETVPAETPAVLHLAPSRGRTSSPSSVRWRLGTEIERCARSGRTQGQRWLKELHAYVEALPANDRRLTLLACGGTTSAVEDFVAVDGQPLTGRFDPCAWLDRYLRWSGRGTTSGLHAQR
jgi:hypothetical protein